MLPPKLRHILGSSAFSEFFFSPKKWPYLGQIKFLKYNGKSISSSAIFKGKMHQNKFRIVIIYDFVSKLLSKTILDLGKCPNQKTHERESAGFLVWALPMVQNRFWKQFLHKVIYNYYSKFFWSVSSLKMAPKKMDCLLYFKNVIWPR